MVQELSHDTIIVNSFFCNILFALRLSKPEAKTTLIRLNNQEFLGHEQRSLETFETTYSRKSLANSSRSYPHKPIKFSRNSSPV